MEEHERHLEQAFETIKRSKLFVKKSKCAFAQRQVEYLGHIIFEEGVAADERKIEAMKNCPTPTSVKALRGFLGLRGYYRRFVQHYGVISKLLTNLLKKGAFKWNQEAEESFQRLKEAMCSTPVLALPNFTKNFIIEADACGMGVGVVLMQEGRPIVYLSKALAPKHLRLSTYEKELLAIVMAVQKWITYLMGQKFVIKTDHEALKYFMGQKLTTLVHQKWLSKMLGFDYTIVYKKGKENLVADGLSIIHEEEGSCTAVSMVVPSWIEEIRRSLDGDKEATELITQLTVDPNSLPDYSMVGES